MRCRKISLRGSSSSIVHVQRDGLLYSCGRSTSPPHLPKGLTKGGEKEGSSFAKQIAQKKFSHAQIWNLKKKKKQPRKVHRTLQGVYTKHVGQRTVLPHELFVSFFQLVIIYCKKTKKKKEILCLCYTRVYHQLKSFRSWPFCFFKKKKKNDSIEIIKMLKIKNLKMIQQSKWPSVTKFKVDKP